ncbi:TrmH family RNA methyltransferase [Acidicapsa dinghuensis]|uniref:TrmH family RNA methyltransferase n=1 Tax=Acidicapsa dinghuensis TaxID=2218256 RepID=A0ABW1EJ79_9BACT|nr:RNA methyltransferase [Acidicapsa dinghuensis]
MALVHFEEVYIFWILNHVLALLKDICQNRLARKHTWPVDLSTKEEMHEKEYPLVTDLRDRQYLRLRSLQTFQGRQRTGNYLIEGIRHLARAVEESAPIEQLFVDPSIFSNRFGQKLVRKLRRAGTPGIRLAPTLYRDLTLAAEPQGVGAVLRQHWSSIDITPIRQEALWLAVESVDQPGNLGTIIRTAEAAGVEGIFLLGPSIDPWDPGCVRATMGSLFAQRLIQCTSRELVNWARSHHVSMIGSSPHGLLDYKTLRSRWPAVLLVGSERHRLSEVLMGASNFLTRIPMCGRADSINAAVATGVLLFELSVQLRMN